MADISKIQVPIDGVMTEFNIKGSGGSANYYGTCTGQASNQIKTVTISSDQGFELKTGVLIFVKFDANNTYSATSSSPIQLNVNDTGAKQIYAANTATPTGTNTTYFGRTNYINQYIYNGTYWVWNGTSSEDEGSGLPNEVITYEQFRAKSDSEQLAYTGYVSGWPRSGGEPVASDVIYDNTDSGLTANNVQDAIDEVDDKVNDIDERLAKTTVSISTRIALIINTEYTTLADGYAIIATTSSGAYTDLYINDAPIIRALCDSMAGLNGIFVKKGSKIKFDGSSSISSQGYFYPLS